VELGLAAGAVDHVAAVAIFAGNLAEQVNGAWIPPGETWSINDHVGARQCPPYQFGGAIVDGEMESVCGGGTSQVATTLLNAAYFAGLDVTGQAHSQYFPRYPRGREATMGAPGTPLDVRIENTTPYGIYIQGGRHGDEVTFTIWSTEHIVVEDLGTTGAGVCVTVTNTRQRTFPDGSVDTDTFTAYYRPGEGQHC
jgi:vancomycin resistance protein YoaR